jgi:hypothetical protein
MSRLRRLPALAVVLLALAAAGAGAWTLATAAFGRAGVDDANRQPLDDNGRQQRAHDRRSASPSPGPSAPVAFDPGGSGPPPR